MKIFFSFGFLLFALSFCGLTDKIKERFSTATKETNVNSSSSSSGSSKDAEKTGDESTEKPALSSEQQAIVDSGQETKWDDQGMSWTLPKNWKKMNQTKESSNYSSPDLAFLLVNISVMPDNFPSDASLKATYESSLQQLKNGKYENARYLEIDGVKGVEFTETMPEDKSGARRHQWIGFRNYQGQNQQLNVMLSTKGSNFEKHRDDFPAILYSMKIQK